MEKFSVGSVGGEWLVRMLQGDEDAFAASNVCALSRRDKSRPLNSSRRSLPFGDLCAERAQELSGETPPFSKV